MAYDGNPISAFTTGEIASITNAALDYYIKGESFAQTIQEKPLLGKMMSKQKTFPGGKGLISIPIISEYTTGIEGFVGDEQVSYDNPNNLKRVTFPWKEIHAGISLTLTELKIDGISVVDTLDGSNVSRHSERDVTVLTNILEHKLADMAEGWARSFNEMLWKDGTQDNKLVPGLSFFIADDPTTGVVGGINRATAGNGFWRNRSLVGANKIVLSARKSDSSSVMVASRTSCSRVPSSSKPLKPKSMKRVSIPRLDSSTAVRPTSAWVISPCAALVPSCTTRPWMTLISQTTPTSSTPITLICMLWKAKTARRITLLVPTTSMFCIVR